jgi:hypothetical protein
VGSTYIEAGEYTSFGLPGSTTADQVTQASSGVIDAFLNRPEGLVWTPDVTGLPCFMAALANSAIAFTAPGAIAPGANVVVPLNGPLTMLQAGDALILDRAEASLMEAVTIVSITPGVSVTLRNVVRAHGASTLLEYGLVILEQRPMPPNRPMTLLAQTPTMRVVSGTGRYGYGRRGDGGNSQINDFNLLAALNAFGGPPVWEVFDPAISDVNPNTGELWVPAGIMLAYYTEVKVRYLAGFSYAALPTEVKFATARAVLTLANTPALGNVKSYKAGGTAIEQFAATVLTDDDKRMLQRYAARTFS